MNTNQELRQTPPPAPLNFTPQGKKYFLQQLLDLPATFGLSVALWLHVMAIVTVVATIRSTVYIWPESAVAFLAGTSIAIIAAMVHRQMHWRIRALLFVAIVAAVWVGTWQFSEIRQFVVSGHRARQTFTGGSKPILFHWFTGQHFLVTSLVVIVAGSPSLFGVFALWEKLSKWLERRLNQRETLFVEFGLFMIVTSFGQSLLLKEEWIWVNLQRRLLVVVIVASIFVVAWALVVYRAKSMKLAIIGSLAILSVTLLTWLASVNWQGFELVTLQELLPFCSVAFFIGLAGAGLMLRPIASQINDELRMPRLMAINLAMLPAVLFGFAGLDFALRWDVGIIRRDQDWWMASAVAKLRRSRVCLEFDEKVPCVVLTPRTKSDAVERGFHTLSSTTNRQAYWFQFKGLHPGIDLEFLKYDPTQFASRVWNWHIVGGELNAAQVQALNARRRDVVFVGTSFIPNTSGDNAGVTCAVKFEGSFERVLQLLELVDFEKQQVTLQISVRCSHPRQLDSLIQFLERVSREYKFATMRIRLEAFGLENVELDRFANTQLKWDRILLSLESDNCPASLAARIQPSSSVPYREKAQERVEFSMDAPKWIGVRLAWPDTAANFFTRLSPEEQVLSAEALESPFDSLYCKYRRDDGTGGTCLVLLHRSWLETLSDEEFLETECLVLGESPFWGKMIERSGDTAQVDELLSRFINLQELDCGQTQMEGLVFTGKWMKIRRLIFKVPDDDNFQQQIAFDLENLETLEDLVLHREPGPEIVQAICTLPNLRSLVIVSGDVESAEEVKQEIEAKLPSLRIERASPARFRDYEPEMMKAHRFRLQEELK